MRNQVSDQELTEFVTDWIEDETNQAIVNEQDYNELRMELAHDWFQYCGIDATPQFVGRLAYYAKRAFNQTEVKYYE